LQHLTPTLALVQQGTRLKAEVFPAKNDQATEEQNRTEMSNITLK
jgi:hypothetical protein